jgi:hypothetical protein
MLIRVVVLREKLVLALSYFASIISKINDKSEMFGMKFGRDS